jgi:hypothetical protein
LTAANIIGGTVKGNIESSGGYCAMIWLRHGAEVKGKVVHRSAGNVGFLDVVGDTHPGSKVRGDVKLRSGSCSPRASLRTTGSAEASCAVVASRRSVPAAGPTGTATAMSTGRSADAICARQIEGQGDDCPVMWHAQSGSSGAVPGATGLLITKQSGAFAPGREEHSRSLAADISRP